MRAAWWKLTITEVDEPNCKLTEADREHIAKQIIEGYEGGEIIHE